jgi:hypothetical protein
MRGTSFVAFIVLFFVGCSGRVLDGEKPRLRLSADSRYSDLPATVRFTAYIGGGRDDDPMLYCPDVLWNFQSVEYRDERDCEPYAPGRRIQRAYVAEHTFEREVAIDVEVRILQRGRTVLRATAEIQVRQSAITIVRP